MKKRAFCGPASSRNIKRLGFERIEVVGNGQSWTYIVEADKPCIPDV
jgi:hypothetical protein